MVKSEVVRTWGCDNGLSDGFDARFKGRRRRDHFAGTRLSRSPVGIKQDLEGGGRIKKSGKSGHFVRASRDPRWSSRVQVRSWKPHRSHSFPPLGTCAVVCSSFGRHLHICGATSLVGGRTHRDDIPDGPRSGVPPRVPDPRSMGIQNCIPPIFLFFSSISRKDGVFSRRVPVCYEVWIFVGSAVGWAVNPSVC